MDAFRKNRAARSLSFHGATAERAREIVALLEAWKPGAEQWALVYSVLRDGDATSAWLRRHGYWTGG